MKPRKAAELSLRDKLRLKVGDVVRETGRYGRFLIVTDCPYPIDKGFCWGWYLEADGRWGGPWYNTTMDYEVVSDEEAGRILAQFTAWRLTQ